MGKPEYIPQTAISRQIATGVVLVGYTRRENFESCNTGQYEFVSQQSSGKRNRAVMPRNP